MHVLGNDALVGRSGFQGEICGLVDAPEQRLVDRCSGKAESAVDNALRVATALPLNQPSLLEIEKGLAQLVVGDETLGSKARADSKVIHF